MLLPHLKHISFIHKTNQQRDIRKYFYLQWKCSRDAGTVALTDSSTTVTMGTIAKALWRRDSFWHWMEDNSMAASVIRQAAMLCVCNQTASIWLPARSIRPMNLPADDHIPFVLQRSPGALLGDNRLPCLWKLREQQYACCSHRS